MASLSNDILVELPVVQMVGVTQVVQTEGTPSALTAVIDGYAAGDLVCQGQALFLTPLTMLLLKRCGALNATPLGLCLLG